MIITLLAIQIFSEMIRRRDKWQGLYIIRSRIEAIFVRHLVWKGKT